MLIDVDELGKAVRKKNLRSFLNRNRTKITQQKFMRELEESDEEERDEVEQDSVQDEGPQVG